jgi:hypothetical protein
VNDPPATLILVGSRSPRLTMHRLPALPRCALCLPRKRRMRNRALRFTLHRLHPGLAALRRNLLACHRMLFASSRILSSLPSRLRARVPRIGSAQRNTSPPRLAQPNSNRLLRRPHAVFPLANVINLLMHKLTRGRRGRLALRQGVPTAFALCKSFLCRACSISSTRAMQS